MLVASRSSLDGIAKDSTYGCRMSASAEWLNTDPVRAILCNCGPDSSNAAKYFGRKVKQAGRFDLSSLLRPAGLNFTSSPDLARLPICVSLRRSPSVSVSHVR